MTGQTILIVDDDQKLISLLKENFEFEGYKVIVGFDGGVAIDLALSRHPDLIILDINMPQTNGFDALTYLRKNPDTMLIPVIFITGLESKTLYPVIDRHQRVAYLKKPIDLEHLNSMARQFLEQYPVEPVKTEPAITEPVKTQPNPLPPQFYPLR
jgi:DNA-binding response OmpR family regulator